MELKSYLLENMEELKDVVAEVNSYNGSLDYLQVFENEDYVINGLFYNNPYELLEKCCFGIYNINHSLIKFNGYGNIESLNDDEYEIELKDNIDDIICELLKVFNKIDVSEQIHELIKKML